MGKDTVKAEAPKLKIARVIGKAVWDQGGNIRDAISIGKLVRKNDGPDEIEQIVNTMDKYGSELVSLVGEECCSKWPV